MMQKKFITNLALLLLLNLLIKPFWILGIDRAVQNAVSPAEYGMFYALFNFSFLFNIFLDFGITNFNNKNIAQNNHLLEKHLSSIIFLRILLAVVYFAFSMAVALIIGYDSKQITMLLVLGVNQFLASFILYLRSNIAGLHLFKTDSIISVLDRLIMIGICSLLLWGGITNEQNPFQIEWYIYSQLIAYIITVLITLVIVIEKAKLKKLNWNKTFFMMIIKKSYPYAILVLLMTFYNRIDSVMLERMLKDGKEQASIYASAYRLLDAGNMIAYLFAGLLLPMFSRMIKQKHSIEELTKLSFSLLFVLSCTVATISLFFSNKIIGVLYQNHVQESAQVFGLLMCCFVCVSTTYVFGTLLTANGNLKALNTMAALGMLLNIILNLVFIPIYNASGSAFSSLFTQALTAICQVMMVQKVFKFHINYKFLFALLLFVVLLLSAAFILNLTNIPWEQQVVLLGIFSTGLALALRIINVKKLIYEFKSS